MNYLGEYSTMDSLYPSAVKIISEHGEPFQPKSQAGINGGICMELRPASFTLLDPTRSLYTGTERRLNYRFWAIEALGYLSGRHTESYTELLCRSNTQYRRYIGPDNKIAGAYGPKLQAGLRQAFNRLASDLDSRQAVCSIWSPDEDLNQQNLMCTLSLHFFTREGELDLQVVMRSNDSNWGLPYDVPAFCLLQIAMASALGIKIGRYHHVAGSLHTYSNTPPTLDSRPRSPISGRLERFPSKSISWLSEAADMYLQELEEGNNLNIFTSSDDLEMSWLDHFIRIGRVSC